MMDRLDLQSPPVCGVAFAAYAGGIALLNTAPQGGKMQRDGCLDKAGRRQIERFSSVIAAKCSKVINQLGIQAKGDGLLTIGARTWHTVCHSQQGVWFTSKMTSMQEMPLMTCHQRFTLRSRDHGRLRDGW